MNFCIVCVYSVCIVLRAGSGLATGWSPVQGVLSTSAIHRRPWQQTILRHRPWVRQTKQEQETFEWTQVHTAGQKGKFWSTLLLHEIHIIEDVTTYYIVLHYNMSLITYHVRILYRPTDATYRKWWNDNMSDRGGGGTVNLEDEALEENQGKVGRG
jgi:hypothetical protein